MTTLPVAKFLNLHNDPILDTKEIDLNTLNQIRERYRDREKMREINITLTFSIFQLSNSVCRNEYFNADYKKDRLERQQKT